MAAFLRFASDMAIHERKWAEAEEKQKQLDHQKAEALARELERNPDLRYQMLVESRRRLEADWDRDFRDIHDELQCHIINSSYFKSFIVEREAHRKFLGWREDIRSRKRQWQKAEQQRMEQLRQDRDTSVTMINPPPITSMSEWQEPEKRAPSPIKTTMTTTTTFLGMLFSLRNRPWSQERTETD